MPAIEMVCARCGASFIATRRTARFCGERCRRSAYAEKRRVAQTAELAPGRPPGTAAGAPGGDEAERDVRSTRATAVLVSSVVDQPQIEQLQPEVAARKRKPLAAVGGFVVLPPVMFILGLLLVVLGQLVAGLIEVAAAIALFTGFYVWGSRHQ